MITSEAYLLDTNIASVAWNEAHHSYPVVRQELEKLAPGSLFISCITNAEIEFGLQSSPDINEAKQKEVRDNMRSYSPLRIDHYTGEHYGKIRASLFRKYWQPNHPKSTKYIEDLIDEVTGKSLGIQENDLWIVSVAVEYHLILVTGDRAGGMKRVVEAASYQDRTKLLPMN